VILEGHGTAGPWRLTDRDVLVKSRRALDRRFIHALIFPDRISRPVTRYGSLLGAEAGGIAAVLDDVVLD